MESVATVDDGPAAGSEGGVLLFADSPATHWRWSHAPLVHSEPIGRERELQALHEMLVRDEVRLLTVTGPAGVGKSNLVLTALRAVPVRNHRLVYINVANVPAPPGLAWAIAHPLGLLDAEETTVFDELVDALGTQPLLLVLDNFEHLFGASATIAALLAMCPLLRVVVTSRVPLRVRMEQVQMVRPLAVPTTTDGPRLKELAHVASVRLFVQRARAVMPDFALNESNVAAVAAICARLEGLPLAIEMAASRISHLPPQALLDALEQPLDILKGGPDRQTHHQSARQAIAWSFDVLSVRERAFLRRLSIFEGGFGLDAMRALGGPSKDGLPDLAPDMIDHLMALVESNLVLEDQRDVAPRFRLMHLVREYAREGAIAAGEVDALLRRHALWVLSFLERGSEGPVGSDQAIWLDAIERDHLNIRAALRWSVEHREVSLGLSIARYASPFWQKRGYITEGRDWWARLLALPSEEVAPSLACQALLGSGILALGQGDLAAAGSSFTAALALARSEQLDTEIVRALSSQGRVRLAAGDGVGARQLAKESVERAARVAGGHLSAFALHYLGLAEAYCGDRDSAHQCFESSLAAFQTIGDRWGIRLPLRGLGILAFLEDRYALARTLLERSLDLSRQRGDPWSLAVLFHDLGYVAQRQGQLVVATNYFREGLLLRRKLSNPGGAALCLVGMATVALERGQVERSVRLFGAAEIVREMHGFGLELMDLAHYDDAVEAVRSAMDPDAFAAGWAEGRTLTLGEAIELGLMESQGKAEGATAPSSAPYANGVRHLTPREREVLGLVARGYSNRQIARELVVTEGTAALHVKHILHKLGFGSRAQVASWTLRSGLVGQAGLATTSPVPAETSRLTDFYT
jgi:predicted ATPase/DNA-binding CsgD family transcriptional regulator